MERTLYLSEEFKEYRKTLHKIGMDGYDLDTLDNGKYEITLIENRYEKLGRKHFPKNPTTTETSTITARQYACYITSIGFFRDRVVKGYTPAGNIVTRLTCQNPDKTLKVERIFRIKYNPDAEYKIIKSA